MFKSSPILIYRETVFASVPQQDQLPLPFSSKEHSTRRAESRGSMYTSCHAPCEELCLSHAVNPSSEQGPVHSPTLEGWECCPWPKVDRLVSGLVLSPWVAPGPLDTLGSVSLRAAPEEDWSLGAVNKTWLQTACSSDHGISITLGTVSDLLILL